MAIPESNLPSWVAWLAQDADGVWWGFEVEPHMHQSGWYENEVGQYTRICADIPNMGWRTTLKGL